MLVALPFGACIAEDTGAGLVTGEYDSSYAPLIPGQQRLELDRAGHAVGHRGDLLRCEGQASEARRDDLTARLEAANVLELGDDAMPCGGPGLTDLGAARICVHGDGYDHCANACIDEWPLIQVENLVAAILVELASTTGGCGPEMWPPPG